MGEKIVCLASNIYYDPSYTRALVFSLDGLSLIGAMSNGSLRMCDIEVKTIKILNLGLGHGLTYAFSRDATVMACISVDTMTVWDLDIGSSPIIRQWAHFFLGKQAESIAISEAKNLVATGGKKMVNLWDTDSGTAIASAEILRSADHLAFSSTGCQLLVDLGTSALNSWNIPVLDEASSSRKNMKDSETMLLSFSEPQTDRITWSMSWGSDDRWVLSGDANGFDCFWSVQGQPQFNL
jgi:WD40 repeat protein